MHLDALAPLVTQLYRCRPHRISDGRAVRLLLCQMEVPASAQVAMSLHSHQRSNAHGICVQGIKGHLKVLILQSNNSFQLTQPLNSSFKYNGSSHRCLYVAAIWLEAVERTNRCSVQLGVNTSSLCNRSTLLPLTSPTSISLPPLLLPVCLRLSIFTLVYIS